MMESIFLQVQSCREWGKIEGILVFEERDWKELREL